MKQIIWCAAKEQLTRVALRFLRERNAVGGDPDPDTVYAVLADGDRILAVVAFWGFDGISLTMAGAAVPGRRWASIRYFRDCLHYAFNVVGARRLECAAAITNKDAHRLAEHCGMMREGRKRQAAAAGSDLIIYGMLRDECRFLPRAEHGIPESRSA